MHPTIGSLARTSAAAVVLAGTLAGSAVLAAGPAAAGSRGNTQSSGTTADAQWVEFGTLPGVAGNAHAGYLFIDASTNQTYAWGSVTDYTCPDGVTPPWGGGGHGGDDPGDCVEEGSRFIYGEPSQITFAIDQKLTEATLVGRLTVSAHGEAGVTPPVDMTLTGFGSKTTQRGSQSFDDGTYVQHFRYTSTTRRATVTGSIGAMDFTDDADDLSASSMGTYRNMERWRTRN